MEPPFFPTGRRHKDETRSGKRGAPTRRQPPTLQQGVRRPPVRRQQGRRTKVAVKTVKCLMIQKGDTQFINRLFYKDDVVEDIEIQIDTTTIAKEEKQEENTASTKQRRKRWKCYYLVRRVGVTPAST